jgi:tetratricopeptide (TPR) repeat protein
VNICDILDRKLDQLLNEPENEELLNDIGVLLYQLKDFDNSEKYLQRSHSLSPENPEILYNYGYVLYRRYRIHMAITVFTGYLQLKPGDVEIIEKLGDCYYQTTQYALAAEMYKRLQQPLRGEI